MFVRVRHLQKYRVLGLEECWNTDPQLCHYRFWILEAVLCRGTGHTSWKVSEFPSTFDFKSDSILVGHAITYVLTYLLAYSMVQSPS